MWASVQQESNSGQFEGLPDLQRMDPQEPREKVLIKRRYTSRACTNCAKDHACCDATRPCTRCVRYGKQATCTDKERKRRAKKPKGPPTDSTQVLSTTTPPIPSSSVTPHFSGFPQPSPHFPSEAFPMFALPPSIPVDFSVQSFPADASMVPPAQVSDPQSAAATQTAVYSDSPQPDLSFPTSPSLEADDFFELFFSSSPAINPLSQGSGSAEFVNELPPDFSLSGSPFGAHSPASSALPTPSSEGGGGAVLDPSQFVSKNEYDKLVDLVSGLQKAVQGISLIVDLHHPHLSNTSDSSQYQSYSSPTTTLSLLSAKGLEAPDQPAVASWDVAGTLNMANDRFRQLFGLTFEDCMGLHGPKLVWKSLVAPEEKCALIMNFFTMDCLRNVAKCQRSGKFLRKDGLRFSAVLTIEFARDEGGLTGCITTITPSEATVRPVLSLQNGSVFIPSGPNPLCDPQAQEKLGFESMCQ